MPDSPEVAEAKRDPNFIHDILGVARDGNHEKCPLCGKKNLRIGPDQNGSGVYLWQCMGGCGGGTAIDALMLVRKLSTPDAMRFAADRYRRPAGQRSAMEKPKPQAEAVKERPAPQEPVLDMDAAQAFVKKAHKHLLDHLELSSFWKRGITEEVIVRHRIGFIENVPLNFHGGDHERGWNIPAAWVLPITAVETVKNEAVLTLKAVKLHFEIPPRNADGTQAEGKSRWAPFGTVPAYDPEKGVRPRHSYYGFWPDPVTLAQPLRIITTSRNWWIERIPPGKVKDAWDAQVQHEVSKAVHFLKKKYADFDERELDMVEEAAFERMRKEIVKAVCSSRNENVPEDDVAEKAVDWINYVFITPGELKAMALQSCGLRATAITSGESWTPPPFMLEPFAGGRVIVFLDDDAPRKNTRGIVYQTGRAFAVNLIAALRRQGAIEILAMSGGRTDVTDEG